MQIQSLRTDDCIDDVIEYYADMVYRLAIAQMGCKEDADDVFQEVFVRLIKHNTNFTNEEHRKAWLIRVTINCCKKVWSSSWKKKVVPFEEEMKDTMTFEMQDESELFYAVQKLPSNFRTVIHLFYYEDMSTKEISKALNVLEPTIRSRLSRARKQLKSLLKEE